MKRNVLTLQKMIEKALAIYNQETGAGATELPLNNVITLDSVDDDKNIEVHAVTKFSVVRWSDGKHVKFMRLDSDDIYTLQDIIHDEYNVEI